MRTSEERIMIDYRALLPGGLRIEEVRAQSEACLGLSCVRRKADPGTAAPSRNAKSQTVP